MSIRVATTADAAAIRNIYAPYVKTEITFDAVLPSTAAFTRQIAAGIADYPWLVWEQNGLILGYVYAHRISLRPAYQWAAELSVYVSIEASGQNIGHKLYQAIMAILVVQHVQAVYGCVSIPNPASERLHDDFHFTAVGNFPHAGFKNKVWHDVRWYQRDLTTPAAQPLPFTPFIQLNQQTIKKILAAS